MRWPKTRTRKRLDAIEEVLELKPHPVFPLRGDRLDRMEQDIEDAVRECERTSEDVDDDLRRIERELGERMDELEREDT